MNGEQVIYDNAEDDEHPNVAPATTSVDATLPPHASFKIKRVDNYYSSWSKAWKFRNAGSSLIPEVLTTVGNGARDGNDPWQEFCFVVVRKLPKSGDDGGEPTYQVVVKSPYLLKACKDVIQKVQGVSWTDEPVEVQCDSTLRVDPADPVSAHAIFVISWIHTCSLPSSRNSRSTGTTCVRRASAPPKKRPS